MIKKGILIGLILSLSGCVGTVRIANDNNTRIKDSTTPMITKTGLIEEEK
ncbi:MAG: Unknown protein [uncultured Sulfurovum sp.]|uniref:Lipoprotein n=1 Tax=uncultured Sulfurovum sp. TaxID=269237 RepID=A0A6S6SEI2_9BACT|nr:MAG: Unknown protein [uncultured Sulfurovum sp.]